MQRTTGALAQSTVSFMKYGSAQSFIHRRIKRAIATHIPFGHVIYVWAQGFKVQQIAFVVHLIKLQRHLCLNRNQVIKCRVAGY